MRFYITVLFLISVLLGLFNNSAVLMKIYTIDVLRFQICGIHNLEPEIARLIQNTFVSRIKSISIEETVAIEVEPFPFRDPISIIDCYTVRKCCFCGQRLSTLQQDAKGVFRAISRSETSRPTRTAGIFKDMPLPRRSRQDHLLRFDLRFDTRWRFRCAQIQRLHITLVRKHTIYHRWHLLMRIHDDGFHARSHGQESADDRKNPFHGTTKNQYCTDNPRVKVSYRLLNPCGPMLASL